MKFFVNICIKILRYCFFCFFFFTDISESLHLIFVDICLILLLGGYISEDLIMHLLMTNDQVNTFLSKCYIFTLQLTAELDQTADIKKQSDLVLDCLLRHVPLILQISRVDNILWWSMCFSNIVTLLILGLL